MGRFCVRVLGPSEFPGEHGFERAIAALFNDPFHAREHGFIPSVEREAGQRIGCHGAAFVP